MSAATGTRGPRAHPPAFRQARAPGARHAHSPARRARAARSFLLAAAAAGEPTQYVPARIGGWAPWLSGPLRSFEWSLSSNTFQTLTLVMCGGYLLVLGGARGLPVAALALAIVAAHVAFVLGPPLLSQDVFGYLGFARMG